MNQKAGKPNLLISSVLMVLLLTLIPASAATHYVNAANPSPAAPYTDWSTAATNIQDAVDASSPGDTVLVTNGVYQYGGRPANGFALTNRVAVTVPIILQSAGGPAVTTIRGYQVPGTTNGPSGVRCVYLANGASLTGFTLTGGATVAYTSSYPDTSGGGVYGASSNLVTVSNCVIAGNSAIGSGGAACNATLTSCILSNNQAFDQGGGAIYCVITNCSIISNSVLGGLRLGGGVANSALVGCTLTGNSVNTKFSSGGGAADSVLLNCALIGNVANVGGGSQGGYATNCTFFSNSVSGSACSGGGSSQGTLNGCLLVGNSAVGTSGHGGGTDGSQLYNCTVTGNSAGQQGGGTYFGVLFNCIVCNNTAPSSSNYYSGILYSCCTAPLSQIGTNNIAADPLFVNPAAGDYHLQSNSPCINSGDNASVTTTTDLDGHPRISGGAVDQGAYEYHFSDTRYVDASNPSPAAPYTDWSTAAVDASLAGDTVLVTNGVYRYGGRPVNGFVLSNRVAVTIPITLQSVNGPGATTILGYQVPGTTNGNSAVRCVYLTDGATLIGFTLTNGATARGGPTAIADRSGGAVCGSTNTTVVISNCVLVGNTAFAYGGGAFNSTLLGCTVATNQAFSDGGGAYFCSLTNCSIISNTGTGIGGGGGVSHCALGSCTLARNSADPNWGLGGGASSSALQGCTLLGNSSSEGGGAYLCTLTNCVISSNSAPPWYGFGGATGGGAYDCTLVNCTLTGNSATTNSGGWGGGAADCVLLNCALIGNVANYGGGAWGGYATNCTFLSNYVAGDGCSGGGSAGDTMTDCLLVGNSAIGSISSGGGADGSQLYNCTITGNSAGQRGGGVYFGLLFNCIAYNNTAPSDSNYYAAGFYSCCVAPLPQDGTNNIAADPLFVNPAAGDYHLQPNSPCINSGDNASVTAATDLDGNPRISSGTVDMGAYELQNPASRISYAWLQQYGLPTDGSADSADTDHNGMSNWQKWRAGLDPTNPNSVLALLSSTNNGPGISVTWQSVGGISYYLQRAASLSGAPAFSSIQSNIVGQAGTTTYQDTNAVGPGPFFYRVGVQ